MRYILNFLTVICLFVFAGCNQESNAAETEYVFLTPQVVVIKNFKGALTSTQCLQTVGRWSKENGLLRDKKGNILRKADIDAYLFYTFPKPLKPGETVCLGEVALTYKPDIPTPVFKLNQVGNGANQNKKYAYMGAWLGSAGALPLKHLAGKEFEIRSCSDNKTVFKGVLKLRCDDPVYQGKTPFTGEEVLELDYSNFNTPGKYYFYVENIGRSMEFILGSETISEAFYIHARGLYHKRCGTAKTQPFSAWESPACHTTVIRGRFPGNAEHYSKGKGETGFGFFDRKGSRIEVKHFDLIRQNPPYRIEKIAAPGGWHDAADYDRRPHHLRIVSDLDILYLLKPENFIDGQLNIPESGNGIPDILDEAAWGLKHLLSVQQSDGGVGTWFETTGHPQPGEGLPDKDKYTYYVSMPSCNSTLEYAATASTLALAFKRANLPVEAEKYWRSSQKAWEFALNSKNRHVATFQYNGKVIFYREEAKLSQEHFIKYAINWYLLTGNDIARQIVFRSIGEGVEAFRKEFWKWSPLSWMLVFEAEEMPDALKNEYRKVILRDADKMLETQENAYPYRTLWHAPDAGWVHTMAWGNYHPLRRALTLIAAHKLSNNEKYLTGAYLANDFHNGANPLGRTMTSGLGKVNPVVFLDLVSYADNAREFVPGITPYGNTFGLDRNAVKMIYGKNADNLPIWRRSVNLEFLSVPASEYSVWETISPAAVTTGYLIEKPVLPQKNWKERKPAADFRKLPGYRALP